MIFEVGLLGKRYAWRSVAYQWLVRCCIRPISQKAMLFVDTLTTLPFRLALVLKSG